MWHESSCTTRGLLLGHRHPDHSKCAVVLGAVKAQALRVGRRQGGSSLDRFLRAPATPDVVGRDEETALPGRTKKLRDEKMDRTLAAPP